MLTSDSWDCDAMLGGDAMRYAIIVLALLGVLASPRPAAAGFGGNDFLKFCERNKAGSNACTFYIVGWRDAFYAATIFRYRAKKLSKTRKWGFAFPMGCKGSR